MHAKLDHSDKIPLFQMIGKNVGIRRASGKFILATNIDILFSDKLMQFIKFQLQPGILYRADRLDVPEQLPETKEMKKILEFCAANYFRINGKNGTLQVQKFLFSMKVKKLVGFLSRSIEELFSISLNKIFQFISKTILFIWNLTPIYLLKTIYQGFEKINR